MWRDLFRRLGAYRGRAGSRADRPVEPDLWETVGRVPRPGSDLLTRIERTALDVYASHGLPTVHGHYRRAPRGRSWTFLGDHLAPEARWALLVDRPPEAGWRYGTLADIGRSGDAEVQAAAALLADCARLQTVLMAGGGPDMLDTLEAAVRLGADWRALEGGRLKVGNTRLRLTAPAEEPDREGPVEARPVRNPRRRTPRAG
ncbi:hypothetical protein [Brevundimonas subvibrioides]|uniref:Uncharacterized protein n=1 Tax=Brevundimonas subvibrioides (strain ATCC 15264 / DSM 4735 / LMG 14903 / NBRC 16000 / CB 81) TaxID=633149 RepID=D9QG60_BRESC|nr:hypothetical protein [Brevundimonas subvibrioides]ADL02602.1 hypothetical protein Bresu_3296 [Brevundimonas subvibrioides ATCC 15264]